MSDEKKSDAAVERKKRDQEQTLPAVTDTAALAGIDSSFDAFLDKDKFAQLVKVAEVFSQSTVVPDHYRKNPANCVIAFHSALRLKCDPIMYMQNTYVVSGRPGMESKLVIALVNSRGGYAKPLDWRFEGEKGKDTWTCFCFTHTTDGELKEVSVTWEIVKAEGWDTKSGSKWKTMPEQMFCYRSAAFFARRYCPEVLLGMSTVDELRDMGYDVETTGRVLDDKSTAPPPLPGAAKTQAANGGGASPANGDGAPANDNSDSGTIAGTTKVGALWARAREVHGKGESSNLVVRELLKRHNHSSTNDIKHSEFQGFLKEIEEYKSTTPAGDTVGF